MKLVSAKRPSEVKLAGLNVTFTVRDNSVTEVLLTDAVGNVCSITSSNSYSNAISVFVPAPPATVKKARLSGTVMGLSVAEDFEYKDEAEARRTEIDENIRDDSAVDLKVEEIEIPDDEVPF